ETYTEKAKRKFIENPWVPLGAVATTAAFSMAAVRMRQGEAKSFNIWLRWRIIFQAVTIAAVCAGTYSFGLTPHSTNPNLEAEADRRRREEKVLRDREEFEKRVQAAMEEHEAE
ncbi:hypoxia induced protein conserved region-domain-containing protein, partial [Pterulicium gracile]